MKSWREGRDPEKSVKEAVRLLVERFNPDRIILFGSRAAGTQSEDSDIDLMVVFNELAREEKRPRAREIYKLLYSIGWPFDIIVASGLDIATHGDTIGYIYRPALREGLTLYERAA